jgi:hypothetical protein
MSIQRGRVLVQTSLALIWFAIHVGCVAAARPARPVERPPVEDEQLVSVPAATPVPSTQQAAAAPSLKVLAVSVQPAQVSRGAQADLIVNYTLSGLAAGAGIAVEEQRELVKDGTTIVQMTDTLTRVAGPHTSAKPVLVPADAAPGIYTLKIVLTAAGLHVEGTALFEVR